jgi:predicted ATPase
MKKFEENSRDELSLVLSAFDDLCIQILENTNLSGCMSIWHHLQLEFSTSFHLLVRTLPNVIRLAPSRSAALSLACCNDEGDVNFCSLCDIIKRFMRAITNASFQVVLFLDDLQWSDPTSLSLVNAILDDKKSSLLFVGTYRDNEVSEEHIVNGFKRWLTALQVPQNTIDLDGITEDDVGSLVSDSLGMLPRLCWSLAQVVFHKTEGNPFFVRMFLRSLGKLLDIGKEVLLPSFAYSSLFCDMQSKSIS